MATFRFTNILNYTDMFYVKNSFKANLNLIKICNDLENCHHTITTWVQLGLYGHMTSLRNKLYCHTEMLSLLFHHQLFSIVYFQLYASKIYSCIWTVEKTQRGTLMQTSQYWHTWFLTWTTRSSGMSPSGYALPARQQLHTQTLVTFCNLIIQKVEKVWVKVSIS